jgi:hypothetical protein
MKDEVGIWGRAKLAPIRFPTKIPARNPVESRANKLVIVFSIVISTSR